MCITTDNSVDSVMQEGMTFTIGMWSYIYYKSLYVYVDVQLFVIFLV